MTKSSSEYGNLESWMNNSRHGNDDDESVDEEALSLSDLPITFDHNQEEPTTLPENILKQEERKVVPVVNTCEAEADDQPEEEEEDFNFGPTKSTSWESEMCVADEVFLRGQILPFRHSTSSSDTRLINRRSLSRSGSMDHYAANTSISSSSNRSSRSSSTGSYSSNSSNSISAGYNSNNNNSNAPRAKIRNNFQYYSYQPSPKPQVLAASTARPSFSGLSSARKSGSTASMWEFLRLGLIKTHQEIALEDLKVRSRNVAVNCNKTSGIYDRNSSSGSNCSSSGSSSNKGNGGGEIKAKRGKTGLQLNYYNKSGGMFSGGRCKCSFGGREVVEPRLIVVKGSSKCGGGGDQKMVKHRTSTEKKKNIEINEDKELLLQRKQQQQEQGTQKAVSSRHRISEWLKELTVVTHSGVLNEF